MSVVLERRIEQTVEREAINTAIQELYALRGLAAQIKNVYANAAAKSDLTFINIIEDKYRDVLHTLQDMLSRVTEEHHWVEANSDEGRYL